MSSVLGKRFSMLGMVAIAATLAGCAMDQTPTSPLRTPGAAHRALDPAPVVTNTNNDGPGSLRAAIASAAQDATVTFADAIAGQTITLTTGELVIGAIFDGGVLLGGRRITIVGSATKGITIDGNNTSRVFNVSTAASKLTLINATITHGHAVGENGGGIHVEGALDLRNSTMTGNTATGLAGFVTGYGGAIAIAGLSPAVTTITNSTITGNSADVAGSAVASFSDAPLNLVNSTISENTFEVVAYVEIAHLTLTNSIISSGGAGTGGAVNCGPRSTVVGTGMNIIGQFNTCLAAGPAVIIGSANLSPLADNGGPTKTMMPLLTSLALDGAPSCSAAEDQRHVARPLGAACDIGAVEFDQYIKTTLTTDATVTVNPTTGVAVVTGTFSCTGPQRVEVLVSLSEPVKGGRVNTTVTASGVTIVDCVLKKLWSIALKPVSGAFSVGDGKVTAGTVDLPRNVLGSSVLEAPVKMFWGHK
jgi:hypothetical protein